jgi:mannosyltransferase
MLPLILAAFALCMWRIDAKSIWWDESLSLHRARGDLAYILSNHIDFPGSPTIDLHPPLYFLVLHMVVQIAGESDLVLRFPSVLFALVLVPLLYAMGRRLRGPRAGLLAALMGAVAPFYLWYAQEARMYTMVTALSLASLYLLWRAFSEHRGRYWAGFGLLAAAAVATQYMAFLVVLCQLGLALWLWRRRSLASREAAKQTIPRRYRWGMVAGGLFVGAVLLIIGYEALRLALEPQGGREYVSLGELYSDALNTFSLGLSVQSGKVWALDIFFLAVFVVGVISLWLSPPPLPDGSKDLAMASRRGAGMIVLVAYIVLPIFLIWLYSSINPVYMGGRYVMMCSPVFYLGLGIGLDALATRTRVVAVVMSGLLLLGAGYSDWRYFNHERYRTKEDYRSAAQYVMANERVNDAIVVNAPENMEAFTHYYAPLNGRRGDLAAVGRPSRALTGRSDAGVINQEMESLTRYDRLWLVHARTMFSDPEDLVTRWLDEHAVLLERKVFPSYGSPVTVSAYSMRPPLYDLEPQGPTVGVFGGRLALRDYALRYFDAASQACALSAAEMSQAAGSLSTMAAAKPVPAGKVLSTVLLWQPSDQLADLKVSLRLIDESGEKQAQRDRIPFMYWPSSKWPADQVIRHEADVPVPADIVPGTYTVRLLVYEAESGNPWVFADLATGRKSPHIDLGQVMISRP